MLNPPIDELDIILNNNQKEDQIISAAEFSKTNHSKYLKY
jgi:hypothetical protein